MAKFEPGKSGNPTGRPLGLERVIREQVQGDVPALIEVLREIAIGRLDPATSTRSPSAASDKDRIAAVKELFDRVLGKPRQSVDVTGEGPAALLDLLGLTPAQRARRDAALEADGEASEAPPDGTDA